MEAETAMTTAAITAIGTVVGAIISGAVALIVSSIQHNKTVAVIETKVEELTKRVDKHNNLVERMYAVEARARLSEEQIKAANHRIEDLEEKS